MKFRTIVFGATLLACSGAVWGQTLDEQKKCAAQASTFFANDQAHGRNADYSSHFNPKNNICYVGIWSMDDAKGGGTVYVDNVYNAFERTAYASFMKTVTPTKSEVVLCTVDDSQGKSLPEFDALVLKKYGLTMN